MCSLGMPINLLLLVFGVWKKTGAPGGNPPSTGRTCNLRDPGKESNPHTWWCSATVLTTIWPYCLSGNQPHLNSFETGWSSVHISALSKCLMEHFLLKSIPSCIQVWHSQCAPTAAGYIYSDSLCTANEEREGWGSCEHMSRSLQARSTVGTQD